jgi:hypothetical protein
VHALLFSVHLLNICSYTFAHNNFAFHSRGGNSNLFFNSVLYYSCYNRNTFIPTSKSRSEVKIMKKLICLLCICLLILGGISVSLAEEPSLPDSGLTEPQDPGSTPEGGGGGDDGVGGGGGWPQ